MVQVSFGLRTVHRSSLVSSRYRKYLTYLPKVQAQVGVAYAALDGYLRHSLYTPAKTCCQLSIVCVYYLPFNSIGCLTRRDVNRPKKYLTATYTHTGTSLYRFIYLPTLHPSTTTSLHGSSKNLGFRLARICLCPIPNNSMLYSLITRIVLSSYQARRVFPRAELS